MFSLPLVIPREDLTLWPSSEIHRPIHTTEPGLQQNHHSGRRNGSHNPSHNAPRSFLAQLSADEAVIAQRKQNIRRFGAGWIRPPGIAKTYQATMDEIAEREEQEILARREAAMLELERAAEEDARREAMEAGDGTGVEEEGERDLDDDIPEAENEDNSDLGDGGDEAERDLDEDVPEAASDDSSEDETEADMTFNEESFIEGSMVQADVEQMLEMEEGQEMMQEERDLDEDVPEAGSYEHTDTEVEESTSDFGGFSQADVGSRVGQDMSGHRLSMPSVGAASARHAGGSSFLSSSPVYGGGRRDRDSSFGPRSNGR